MERTAINPWAWAKSLGYDQAHLVVGPARHLHCAGQTAVDPDGRPVGGDMARQMEVALDNLEAVLAAAGMGLSDVVRLGVFATDVDAALAAWGTLAARLGRAGASPPTTLLGVTRLAVPGLSIELEATAAAAC